MKLKQGGENNKKWDIIKMDIKKGLWRWEQGASASCDILKMNLEDSLCRLELKC